MARRRRWRTDAHQIPTTTPPAHVAGQQVAAHALRTVSPLPVADLRRVGLIILLLGLVLAGASVYMHTGTHAAMVAKQLGRVLNLSAD